MYSYDYDINSDIVSRALESVLLAANCSARGERSYITIDKCGIFFSDEPPSVKYDEDSFAISIPPVDCVAADSILTHEEYMEWLMANAESYEEILTREQLAVRMFSVILAYLCSVMHQKMFKYEVERKDDWRDGLQDI